MPAARAPGVAARRAARRMAARRAVRGEVLAWWLERFMRLAGVVCWFCRLGGERGFWKDSFITVLKAGVGRCVFLLFRGLFCRGQCARLAGVLGNMTQSIENFFTGLWSMPVDVWLKVFAVIAALTVLSVILRRVMQLSTFVLVIALVAVAGVVTIKWMRDRNEPRFMTPTINFLVRVFPQ